MTRYFATGDLHLKPESAKVVFEAFDVMALSAQYGRNTGPATDLVIVGDLYDERYSVPIALQNQLLDKFEYLLTVFDNIRILPGNHDQDSADGRHALEVFDGLEGPVGRVVCYTHPHLDEHGAWLPYRKDTQTLVDYANSPIVGKAPRAWLHHGIKGAMMNDHAVAGEFDGIDPDHLSHFPHVIAGHWHRPQTVKNVTYVGSPWQTRADEAGQDKRFLIIEGGNVQSCPILVGPRHFSVRVGPHSVLPNVQPGDKVHLVAADDASPEDVQALKDRIGDGVQVTYQPPKPKEKKRLTASAHTPIEVATAYAEEHHGEFTPDSLLALFKEIQP